MILLALSTSALAATLTVGPSGPYTTIAAALAAASSGDTVSVEPGVYAENVDLRGRSVNLTSTDGPRWTTITLSTYVAIDGGSISGFTIDGGQTGVVVTGGAPTVRELVIEGASTYGVSVESGTPTIQEVAVLDSGLHGFLLKGGTPTVRRVVSVGAGETGVVVRTATDVRNSLAIGGKYGFSLDTATATLNHVVALDNGIAGVVSLAGASVAGAAFRDNVALLKCSGGQAVFSTTIAYAGTGTSGCSSTPTFTDADPLFRSWATGRRDLDTLDLRPASGSPMVNAATGTDPDGSTGDVGLFGGAQGAWTDADADGTAVLFDCDDHDADTFPGAPERGDGVDNDCDDVVDEDVPVDTGGGDTGDTGDTADTGAPILPTDLDGDGFTSDVDCSEHNRATYPGADERGDGADNDCDGFTDEGTPFGDDDGDGYTEITGDCDDYDRDRYPGAVDSRPDGVDNDCDGVVGNPVAHDDDQDGHIDQIDDCDDTDPYTFVGAEEFLDGSDNDCDGRADEHIVDADADGDGRTVGQGDCDDGDAGVYRGNAEVPDDFVDQDCTGEDLYDQDADGFASPASGGDDCDDLDSSVNPGHAELCDDGQDDDCDGEVDEGCDVEPEPVATADAGCGCAAGGGLDVAGVFAGLALAFARARRRESSR